MLLCADWLFAFPLFVIIFIADHVPKIRTNPLIYVYLYSVSCAMRLELSHLSSEPGSPAQAQCAKWSRLWEQCHVTARLCSNGFVCRLRTWAAPVTGVQPDRWD